MNFYMDESGSTGDIAATDDKLQFGGQPVFSLAAVGIPNEESLTQALNTLRRKHNVKATELKLSKIIKRKPEFALSAIDLLINSDFPFFVEVVDKRYQLAASITNGFIWPPYFNIAESQKTVWLKNIFADYIYYKAPDHVLYEFVQCMREPSNERTDGYFDLLRDSVNGDFHEVAQSISEQVEESKDDFRLMTEQEGDLAYLRFLPIPDSGKREQAVWLLPNFSSFTNIYARMNLYLSGELGGCRIFHDEQAQFDEIIAKAKLQVEEADMGSATFKPPHSDYNFEQMTDLIFKTSPESTGIQLADIVAGMSMRWYLAHMQQDTDTEVLDEAMDRLICHSNRNRGVGINVVGPNEMAQQLFGVSGY